MVDLPQIAGVGKFSNFFGSLSTTGVWIVLFTFLIGGLLGGAWFYFWWRKYNIKVIIFSKRGGGKDKIYYDRGGYMNYRGVDVFRLMKKRVNLQAPPFIALYPAKKGTILFLRQVSSTNFIPVLANVNEEKGASDFQALDEDDKAWAVLKMKINRERYLQLSFFEKYGHWVIFGISFMLSIILIYIVLDKFSVLQGVAQSLKETAQALRESTAQLASKAP